MGTTLTAAPASASGRGGSESGPAIPLKMSKVELLMKKELEAKAAKAKNSGGHWLVPGIIVKVMSKNLKEHGWVKALAGRLFTSNTLFFFPR